MDRRHLPCKGYVLSWMILFLQVPGLGRKRPWDMAPQCNQAWERLELLPRGTVSLRQWRDKNREETKRLQLHRTGL